MSVCRAQVTPWLDINLGNGYYSPNAVLAISVSLNNSDYVMSAVSILKNSDLAIMGKHGGFMYIDLQQLCRSFPKNFLNLDTMEPGCE